jgi:hypothetical protein
MAKIGAQPFSVLLTNFKTKWNPGYSQAKFFTASSPVPGEETYSRRWTPGWSHAEFFELGGNPFLFIYKEGSGDYHIYSMLPNGKLGNNRVKSNIGSGWSICRVFKKGSGRFLFLMSSATGKIRILRVETDGTLGARTFARTASDRFTSADFYYHGSMTYLFMLEADSGKVCVWKMTAAGAIGANTELRDWTAGWTHAEFYKQGDATNLLVYKKGAGTVVVLRMTSGGKIGSELARYEIARGWSSLTCYQLDDVNYLALVDTPTGKRKFVELKPNGRLGREEDEGEWSSGWTTVRFYQARGALFLFRQKRDDGDVKIFRMQKNGPGYFFLLKKRDGLVRTHELWGNGHVGKRVWDARWTAGWTTVEFFVRGGRTYQFLLKESSGLMVIKRMNTDGTMGSEVARQDWTSGWTTAKFFNAGGRVYLFLLKKGSGDMQVRRMLHDGRVGAKVDSAQWTRGWTSAAFYEIGGATYLMLLKERSGEVHIHRMKTNGTVGPQVKRYDWTPGWTTVEPYVASRGLFLFLLKKGDGRVVILRVKPDGTMGGEVMRRRWSSGWTGVQFYPAGDRTCLFLLKESSGAGHLHWVEDNGAIGDRVDPDEPNPPSFYANLITNRGLGKNLVADYFKDNSKGKMNLNGSLVKGWYTIQDSWENVKLKQRGGKISASITAARTAGNRPYAVPSNHTVIAMHSAPPDSGATGAGNVLGHPFVDNVTFLAHEMLHTLGMGHSYSDDLEFKSASWSSRGEYNDAWDIMSAMSVHWHNNGANGKVGPSLNTFGREKLGWLDPDDTLTVPRNRHGKTYTLFSLTRSSRQPIAIRVPFGDKGFCYSVEYQIQEAWDAGIPLRQVLIRKIHEVPDKKNKLALRSQLLRTRGGLDPDRSPDQWVYDQATGIAITVISTRPDSARVYAANKRGNAEVHRLRNGGRAEGEIYRDQWPEGIDTLTTYTVGSKMFLFAGWSRGSGSDGFNALLVNIFNNGVIGGRIESRSIRQGFTTAGAFTVGGSSYLFLLAKADGMVEIYRLAADGKLSTRVYRGNWTSGWSNAEFFETGSNTYLLVQKTRGFASDDNNFHVYRMKSNGTVGAKKDQRRWSEGWTTLRFYTVGSKHYLFMLKSGTGDVQIRRMNASGTIGSRLWSGKWTDGWTSAAFFVEAGTTYLVIYKSGTGRLQMHEMNSNGTVGERVDEHAWTPGRGFVETYSAGGKNYLVMSRSGA